ncbi:hypothetical protein [Dialister succinatiphilus]|uniref:Lipoprotein n=1 Tax=Dialister succinatiphilus YIT 11850 TaxID=742743 RepID=H1D2T2_9FIRM|nr:hypothetical protein [Dialister succinatiphilus]EHO62202.1 hypothetical protein HMPREF9453_01920 [Dialister succinatiphilus YIT 11850]
MNTLNKSLKLMLVGAAACASLVMAGCSSDGKQVSLHDAYESKIAEVEKDVDANGKALSDADAKLGEYYKKDPVKYRALDPAKHPGNLSWMSNDYTLQEGQDAMDAVNEVYKSVESNVKALHQDQAKFGSIHDELIKRNNDLYLKSMGRTPQKGKGEAVNYEAFAKRAGNDGVGIYNMEQSSKLLKLKQFLENDLEFPKGRFKDTK